MYAEAPGWHDKHMEALSPPPLPPPLLPLPPLSPSAQCLRCCRRDSERAGIQTFMRGEMDRYDSWSIRA